MGDFKLRNGHKAEAFALAIGMMGKRRNAELARRRVEVRGRIAGALATLAVGVGEPAIDEALAAEGYARRLDVVETGAWGVALDGEWGFAKPWAVARDAALDAAAGAGDVLDRVAGPEGRWLRLPCQVTFHDLPIRGSSGPLRLARPEVEAIRRLERRDAVAMAAGVALDDALEELEWIWGDALGRLGDAVGVFRVMDACETRDQLVRAFPAAATLFAPRPRTIAEDGAARALRDLA